jgi:hypothetical protein
VLDGVNVELASSSVRLGQLADEAVVVAYRNRSTHSGIERLGRQLAQVGVPVLGGVLLSRRTGLRGKLGGGEKRPRRSADTANHREDANAAGPLSRPDAAHPAEGSVSDGSPTGGPRIGQPTMVGTPPSGSASSGATSSRSASSRKN